MPIDQQGPEEQQNVHSDDQEYIKDQDISSQATEHLHSDNSSESSPPDNKADEQTRVSPTTDSSSKQPAPDNALSQKQAEASTDADSSSEQPVSDDDSIGSAKSIDTPSAQPTSVNEPTDQPKDAPNQPESNEDTHEDENMDNTAKRQTVVVPPSQPQPDKVITPRQEKAMRYLERKRTRHDRLSAPMPAVQANGTHELATQSVDGIVEQQTVKLPAPAEQTPLAFVGGDAAHYTYRTDKPRTAQALRLERHRKVLLRHISRKHIRQGRLHEKRSTQRLWTTILTTLAIFIIIFLSAAGAGGYISYNFYIQTESNFSSRVLTLHDLLPRDNLKMYDSKGILIDQVTDSGMQTTVPLSQISKDLVNATVAVEDKTFWQNPGVDVTRTIQAAIDDLTHNNGVSGGSTITQQLVKNIVLDNQEQTIIRKLQEILLTPQVNSQYSKPDIMSMYLNSILYGEQAYGIDAAATVYFGLEDQPGKPAASQLDLAQAAMLAGIPNSPTAFDPFQHPVAAYNRFQVVLDSMVRNGYITRQQAIDAENEAKSPNFYKGPPQDEFTDRAPHFAEFVLGQLETQFHMTRAQLSRSGMSVTTTLDITLQDQIQKIMQDQVAALAGHNVTNAAEVLMNPHTGAIISLLGSIDYNNKSIDGQYDVATQGWRQPGSSFKPYVYVTAFENGTSPGQAVDDNKLVIPQPGAAPYSPPNYSGTFQGHMTLRCALQNSLNVPSVKVLQHVGVDNAINTANQMGMDGHYQGTPGLSMVLGGLDVHLLDHTSAFSTFANGGVHIPYYAIQKVVFSNNQQTYVHQQAAGTRVLSPQIDYMMTNVLSDNQSRLPEFFDCNVLQLYSNSQQQCYEGNRGAVRPAAAKTGTTDNFVDNWTMGYTTDFMMGVWAGNDDNSPMRGIQGVQGAAPIWHDAMLLAEQGHPIQDFPNPGGLTTATVTYPDGVRSTDLYLPGKVPTFAITPPKPTGHGGGRVTTQADETAAEQAAGPYCPNDFSYAFPAPANDFPDGTSPNSGWW